MDYLKELKKRQAQGAIKLFEENLRSIPIERYDEDCFGYAKYIFTATERDLKMLIHLLDDLGMGCGEIVGWQVDIDDLGWLSFNEYIKMIDEEKNKLKKVKAL